MNVYLAGPMRGIPDFNFPIFDQAANALRSQGYEVFSPAEKGAEILAKHDPSLAETIDFRRKVFLLDTEYICSTAKTVAMLPGWEASSGARAEWALAQALGLRTLYLGPEYGRLKEGV